MGGLAATTSYADPNVNIQTGPVPGVPGLGNLTLDPFFLNFAKKRMAAKELEDQYKLELMKRDLAKPQDMLMGRADPEADLQKYKDIGYERQLQQMDLAPPKKVVQGFNMMPGYVDDVTALPLSLRPKGAAMTGEPGASPAGLNPKSAGTGGYDPVAAEKQAREDLNGPTGGGPGRGPTGGEIQSQDYQQGKGLSDMDWEERRRAQRQMLYGGLGGARG